MMVNEQECSLLVPPFATRFLFFKHEYNLCGSVSYGEYFFPEFAGPTSKECDVCVSYLIEFGILKAAPSKTATPAEICQELSLLITQMAVLMDGSERLSLFVLVSGRLAAIVLA